MQRLYRIILVGTGEYIGGNGRLVMGVSSVDVSPLFRRWYGMDKSIGCSHLYRIVNRVTLKCRSRERSGSVSLSYKVVRQKM